MQEQCQDTEPKPRFKNAEEARDYLSSLFAAAFDRQNHRQSEAQSGEQVSRTGEK